MSRIAAVAAIAAGIAGASGYASAQADDPRIIATVGTSTVTAGRVNRVLVQLGYGRLAGADRAAQTNFIRRVVDKLVLDEVWHEEGKAKKLLERPEVQERIDDILKRALVYELRSEAAAEVSDTEVKAYYDSHKERYQEQLRVKMWRIRLTTKADAEALIQKIAKSPAFKKDPNAAWDALCQEVSKDRVTRLSKGNVGFVTADGRTAQKGLRVTPEMYKAALAVENGQLVPTPIKDVQGWAVVQRRGKHHTPVRPLEIEAPTIRAQLARAKIRSSISETLDRLRRKYVSLEQTSAVERLELTSTGEISAGTRPGALRIKRHPATGSPRPQGHPGHLR